MAKSELIKGAVAFAKEPKPASCVERTPQCCIRHGTQGCLTSRRIRACPSLPHEKKVVAEAKKKSHSHHKAAGKK